MSQLRSFVVAFGLFAAGLLTGCGKSPPPVAQANNVVQPDEGGSTDLGAAHYQPSAAANQASPTVSAVSSPPAVAPPTAGMTPPSQGQIGPNGASSSVVTPPAISPPTALASGAGPGVQPAAVPGQAPGATASTAPGTALPAPSGSQVLPPSAAANPPTPAAGRSSSASGGPPPGGMASGDMRGLAAAVNQWRSPGTNLAGVKRFDDKPVSAANSWMIQLLPHVGYGDLYAKFNHTKGWYESENVLHACQVIPAFLDPGNPNHSMKSLRMKNAIGPAFTHFVGMAGIEDSRNVVAASLPRSDPRAGIFGYDQIARPEEITDGASNTIMIISAGKIVGAWASGGGATIRGARAPYFDSITGFGTASDAGGGALVAMADGSVKRISKDIDPAVFRALCTIHGGEKVDLPANTSIRAE